MSKNSIDFDKKEDLRSRRTRKFLADSLLDLLSTTPLEQISIQDICEKAMIHRTTFYSHFEDKYDLFEYVLNNFRDSIFSQALLNAEYTSLEELYTSLTETAVEYVDKNKGVLLKILQYNSDKFASDLIFSTMEQSIRQLLEKSNKYSIPLPVISNFLTGGFIALVTWWLDNPKVSKQDLLKYIRLLIKDLEACYNLKH